VKGFVIIQSFVTTSGRCSGSTQIGNFSVMRDFVFHQIGALPLCVNSAGRVETFLVTTKGGRRWIIPKGNTIPGLEPHEVAAQEALEEAGLVGTAGRRCIGNFELSRGCAAREEFCCVDVYAFWVERQLNKWREMRERTVLRCTVDRALSLVCTPSLGELVGCYVAAIENKSSFARRRGGYRARRDLLRPPIARRPQTGCIVS
jgi:8-oxo-dGTP pyrophosphatase MutT (NUDIX family)